MTMLEPWVSADDLPDDDPDGLYVPDTVLADVDMVTAALAYARAGWYVGPVKAGKHPGSLLGAGWPTMTSRDPRVIESWFRKREYVPTPGLFLHVGRSGAWVADVDHPERMPAVLVDAIEAVRPPYQSTRPDQPDRGHYVFAQPPGRVLGNSTGKLGKGWGEARGLNGVVVVAPTPHPNGGCYDWYFTGPVPVLPASVADLLPDSGGPGNTAASGSELGAFLADHAAASRPTLLKAVTDKLRSDLEEGASRHEATLAAACWALREAACGFYPASDALEALEDIYTEARSIDRPGGRGATSEGAASAEFAGIAAWAVAQVENEDLDELRAETVARLADNAEAEAEAIGVRTLRSTDAQAQAQAALVAQLNARIDRIRRPA